MLDGTIRAPQADGLKDKNGQVNVEAIREGCDVQQKLRSAALVAALTVYAAAAQAQDIVKVGGIGPLSGGGTAWNVVRFRRGVDARSIPPI